MDDMEPNHQWKTLMTANATTAQGARQEVELAFCPQHVGGSDNCAPTKCAPRQEPCWTGPNGTKVLPRNGALIQGQWKLVYGEQVMVYGELVLVCSRTE
jgi:hypothetical protein